MRRARIQIAACFALGLALCSALGGARALASDRRYTPLTVSIVGAEAIVAGRILSAAAPAALTERPERVRLAVLRTFKGSLAGPEITLVLKPYQRDLVHRLETGSEHVLFIAPTTVRGEYLLTDETLLPYDESQSNRLAGMIPLAPTWSAASAGLQMVVVPDHEPSISGTRDPFRFQAGEPVLLWAGYRNVSHRDIVLRYRDWPLASHTRWDLRVERAGAGAVESRPHPHVDGAGIRDFFSRHGHRFDYALKPGDVFFLYLDRINIAEAGWGYRERLDFRYYPMSERGEYTISAIGRFFHPGVPITSRVLRVWVD